MSIKDTQMLKPIVDIVSEQIDAFNADPLIIESQSIPIPENIQYKNWTSIPNVICVYADMAKSTQLSVETHPKSSARSYTLYTGTASKIFHHFEASHIDIKGDGVFALFNSNQTHRALCAAVTFKTFAEKIFIPFMQDRFRGKPFVLGIGSHIAIVKRNVLVKRIGIQGYDDRQNPVWAGRQINMASKLASQADSKTLLVCPRFYAGITHGDAKWSCCSKSGSRGFLWTERNIANENLDFDKAWALTTTWCETHGKEYCSKLLLADG